MRVDLYGLAFETPKVTYHLWSPWRCSLLETRLFDAVAQIQPGETDRAPDEKNVCFRDPRAVKASIATIERILKGWQEEAADSGSERRSWRWLIESDVDAHGFDFNGDTANIWGFIRLFLQHNNPGETEPGDEFDLSGFGFCVWGNGEN